MEVGVMPRETISDLPSDNLAVEVTWGRDSGSVQIATTNQTIDHFALERGWFKDLNRDEINRLITVLRRARDQAFGKDA